VIAAVVWSRHDPFLPATLDFEPTSDDSLARMKVPLFKDFGNAQGVMLTPARVGQATLGSAGLEVRRIASIARLIVASGFDDNLCRVERGPIASKAVVILR